MSSFTGAVISRLASTRFLIVMILAAFPLVGGASLINEFVDFLIRGPSNKILSSTVASGTVLR